MKSHSARDGLSKDPESEAALQFARLVAARKGRVTDLELSA